MICCLDDFPDKEEEDIDSFSKLDVIKMINSTCKMLGLERTVGNKREN